MDPKLKLVICSQDLVTLQISYQELASRDNFIFMLMKCLFMCPSLAQRLPNLSGGHRATWVAVSVSLGKFLFGSADLGSCLYAV